MWFIFLHATMLFWDVLMHNKPCHWISKSKRAWTWLLLLHNAYQYCFRTTGLNLGDFYKIKNRRRDTHSTTQSFRNPQTVNHIWWWPYNRTCTSWNEDTVISDIFITQLLFRQRKKKVIESIFVQLMNSNLSHSLYIKVNKTITFSQFLFFHTYL